MKSHGEQPQVKAGSHAGVVLRFLVISLVLGFLIGLFEASLLWATPRVIPLLVPDVAWVIWFLTPLVDMIFFALVGLGVGWLASRTSHKEVFVAVEAAIAATFVYLRLVWFHGRPVLLPLNFEIVTGFPLIVLVIAFAISLMVFAAAWHRLAAFPERWMGRVLRPLSWSLAAIAVIAMAGVGAFILRSPMPGPAAPATALLPPSAPNIIFITLDTVRADHLSAYGYPRPTTPNLDRFSRTGVLFKNAIAPAPWTLPSHASMFTGLLPEEHGADFAVPMASRPLTLAEGLRSQGYQTAAFIGNTLYLDRGWNIGQGFDVYDDASVSFLHNLSQTLIGTAVIQPLYEFLWESGLTQLNFWFERRSASDLNAAVLGWLRRRQHRPYFLFINYIDAHDPYFTSEPYESRFGRLPATVALKLHPHGQSFRIGAGERALLIDGYDNCLAYLDSQVGELLRELRRLPDWQKTVVIITSDHGEEFGGHEEYTHGLDLYRALLHVPLIIAGPGIPKGVHISHIVATRDLFSTVLDLAGGGHTPFSRTSLARFWNPNFKPEPFDDAVVSEDIPLHGPYARRAMASLTTPQWEYIEHRDGRKELYHWTTDPHEEENLASSPGDQATLDSLRTRLIALVSNATGPWRGTPYLQALDKANGSTRLNLLYPKPLVPGAAGNPFRIGIAQAYFESRESTPARPSQSEQDILKSLPY